MTGTHADADDDANLLGLLAVRLEILEATTLVAALKQHRNETSNGATRAFGEILVERGHLNNEQLGHLVAVQGLLRTRHADRDFAAMALETGQVSADEIEYAFAAQEKAFATDRTLRLLGDLLVEFGAIEPDLRDALLAQQGRSSGR